MGKKISELYRIEVAGMLDPDWSERLGGLHIAPRARGDSNDPVTVLRGHVSDQAQLSGILNTLNDLRYKLLSVQIMGMEKTNEEP